MLPQRSGRNSSVTLCVKEKVLKTRFSFEPDYALLFAKQPTRDFILIRTSKNRDSLMVMRSVTKVSKEMSLFWTWQRGRCTFGGTKVERPRRAMKLILYPGTEHFRYLRDKSWVQKIAVRSVPKMINGVRWWSGSKDRLWVAERWFHCHGKLYQPYGLSEKRRPNDLPYPSKYCHFRNEFLNRTRCLCYGRGMLVGYFKFE